ncbi:TPA: hypothetical protein R1765_001979 [Campylobacter coli]|nr:hypothetical protein [Campylobacter coli]
MQFSMHKIEIDVDLLVRIKKILTEVDNLSQKMGHPKKAYIRQTLRDLIIYMDARKED